MGFVRLDARRRRSVVPVAAGGETATGTVPLLRDCRVNGKGGSGFVPVCAPERDAPPRCRLAPVRFAHRARPNTTASDGAATCHEGCPPRARSGGSSLNNGSQVPAGRGGRKTCVGS